MEFTRQRLEKEGFTGWLPFAAKLNDVNPQAWLADVLDQIGKGHPINRIDELLPWSWSASRA